MQAILFARKESGARKNKCFGYSIVKLLVMFLVFAAVFSSMNSGKTSLAGQINNITEEKLDDDIVISNQDLAENNDTYTIGDATYTFSEGVATISGTGSTGMGFWGPQLGHRKPELKKAIICEGITTIDGLCFYGCYNLEEVILPNSLESIGYAAFFGCNGLTSINLPDNLITISKDAFDKGFYNGNQSIFSRLGTSTAIAVSKAGYPFRVDNESCFIRYDFEGEEISGFVFVKPHDNKAEKYIIPSYITSIENSAFMFNGNLKEVIIPEGVKMIGDQAFSACRNLKHVTLPNSLLSIGDFAFSNCRSLERINFSSGVISIGKEAFYNTGLSSVTIPENVKIIGDNAFNGDVNSIIGTKRICFLGRDISLGDTILPLNFTTSTIYCYSNSDAEDYADAYGYAKVLLDDKQLEELLVLSLEEEVTLSIAEDHSLRYDIFPASIGLMGTWYSSDSSIVSVDNTGHLTPHSPGSAIITLSCLSEIVQCKVTIAPLATELVLPDIVYVQFKRDGGIPVQINPKNAKTDLVFSISDESIVAPLFSRIEGEEYIHFSPYWDYFEAKEFGTTELIITELYSGLQKIVPLTVCYPVTEISFSEESIELKCRSSIQLIANVKTKKAEFTNQLITFRSSDPGVASVNWYTGEVTARNEGIATITASSINGISASCTVTVLPSSSILIPEGTSIIEDEAFFGTAAEVYYLPDGVVSIGSQSFGNLKDYPRFIFIPPTVTHIADDAFENSMISEINVQVGTYAEQWALEHGFYVIELNDYIY